MRKVVLKVQYKVPQGTELTRLTKKSAVSNIYIGKPSRDMQATAGNTTRIQLNDKYASVSDVIDYVSAEKIACHLKTNSR